MKSVIMKVFCTILAFKLAKLVQQAEVFPRSA